MAFKPLFVIVTVIGICVARWTAVFPLSRAINWFIRFRARRRGREAPEELPHSYQVMLFWAGLRGAVGVALAAGMTGENQWALKATVLVVVVLTVIIFGGTTARMLEILGIRTGVVEEIDSDDEFDIEAIPGGSYYKNSGTGVGNNPRRSFGGAVQLDGLNGHPSRGPERGTYASGNHSPANRPSSLSRKNSTGGRTPSDETVLLDPDNLEDDIDSDTSDLPPAATNYRKKDQRTRQASNARSEEGDLGNAGVYPTSGRVEEGPHITASGAISQLLHGTAEENAEWFRMLDEGFIKPKLLLDSGKGSGSGHGGGPS